MQKFSFYIRFGGTSSPPSPSYCCQLPYPILDSCMVYLLIAKGIHTEGERDDVNVVVVGGGVTGVPLLCCEKERRRTDDDDDVEEPCNESITTSRRIYIHWQGRARQGKAGQGHLM